jgi:hypothetical protein
MKTIHIPQELHTKLKMIAMSKNVSLQELIIKILQSSFEIKTPATTPKELTGEFKEFYSRNQHLVESTRTLMACSLEEAIQMSMEAEKEFEKFGL